MGLFFTSVKREGEGKRVTVLEKFLGRGENERIAEKKSSLFLSSQWGIEKRKRSDKSLSKRECRAGGAWASL